MADGRNPWLWWALPVVVIAVLALSNWSWRQKPVSTLIALTSWHTSAQLSAEIPKPIMAWRLVVDLPNDLKPPGPEWMLYEGVQPGQGYELHWIPARLSLQVWRSGDHLQLLGSATLDRAPRQVVFARRGLRLAVDVDGVSRIACLDLQSSPAPEVWGTAAAADVGGARISLYDESRYLTKSEQEVARSDLASLQHLADDPAFTVGSVHAIARVRVALVLGAQPGAVSEQAGRDARVALRALPENHSDRATLLAWIGWEDNRSALQRGDDSALVSAANALAGSTDARTAGEYPGLVIDLICRLADRTALRPTRPIPPMDIFTARRAWLSAISTLGTAVLDLDTGEPGTRFAPSENLAWHLRLAVHAADCLIGRQPQPTPADGPTWAADRWRAFAGVPVRVRALTDEPGSWRERDPVTVAVQGLVNVAGIDPLPAIGVRAAVEAALSHDDLAAVRASLADAPPDIARQVALTQAILATRGLIEAADARAVLNQATGSEHPLVSEDPLAFAIDRLLELGLRKRPGGSGVLPGVPKLPASLAWAGPILSGQPGATAEVWRVQPDHPMEGLAAALLMQEIAGESPDWSLLAQAPSFTLPLRLLMPVTPAKTPLTTDVPEPVVPPPVVP